VRVVHQPATTTRGADVVIAALGLLADRGMDCRADVLRLVVRALPALRSLSLRTPGGAVALASGRPSGPDDPCWVLEIPMRPRGGSSEVLSVVSSTPLTAEEAMVLRGVADAIGLVAANDVSVRAASRAVLDAEADLALVAAELDESVAESLVALRHTQPEKVREAATASLAEVRRIGRRLRAQALGDGLRAALHVLRERGVTVETGSAELDAVPPAVAVLVERVAQAVCATAVGNVRIRASVDKTAVKLRVESADNEIDASEVERWRRRAQALHGELRHWAGGVELILPAPTGIEGRHDDGLDLRRPPRSP
jgi:hypothetical protein